MKRLIWIERQFTAGTPAGMLPFFIERLDGTMARLENKVKNVPEDVLSNSTDGKWSIKQNIGHLAEMDGVGMKRIQEILEQAPVMSPAILETQQDYNAQPIAQVLAYFNELRRKKIGVLNNLSDDELLRTSLHPRLKMMMTPVDLAGFQAEHDDHHLVTINEILKRL